MGIDIETIKEKEVLLEKRSKAIFQIPVPYVFFLGLAAVSVSLIGAYFSVTGLAHLFSGAQGAVMVMAGALEGSKLIAAGFLHHNWKSLNVLLRTYLTVAVMVLMMITSLGIFGYLSNAYQKSSLDIKNSAIGETTLRAELERTSLEQKRLQRQIDDIPLSRVNRRSSLQKDLEPEFRRLRAKETELNEKLSSHLEKKNSYQAEVGPLVYVAESFGMTMDQVAKWFILIFVSVFDPLAICLVFAVSWSLKKDEKEEEELFKKLVTPRAQPKQPSTLTPPKPVEMPILVDRGTQSAVVAGSPLETPPVPVKRGRGRPRKYPRP